MLANERLKHPIMKQIGSVLAYWVRLNMSWMHLDSVHFNDELGDLVSLFQRELGRSWKEAHGHYLDFNLTLMKDSVYAFALFQQCVVDVSHWH